MNHSFVVFIYITFVPHAQIAELDEWPVPPMAGHSMSLVDNTKVWIVGGFSATNYYSEVTYEFDARNNEWRHLVLNGSKPTGECRVFLVSVYYPGYIPPIDSKLVDFQCHLFYVNFNFFYTTGFPRDGCTLIFCWAVAYLFRSLLAGSIIAGLGPWAHSLPGVMYFILVWSTCRTPAVGGLIVCEWVCVSEDMSPYCSAHDEWNFACMSGTMMPTMCQILVVTQWPN